MQTMTPMQILKMPLTTMLRNGLIMMAMATAITRREQLPIRAKELQELQP